MGALLLHVRVLAPRPSLLLLGFLVLTLCAPPILAAPHAHTGQHAPAPSVVHSHLAVTAHPYDLSGALPSSSNLTATSTFFDATLLVASAKQSHVALGTQGRKSTLHVPTGGPGSHGIAERQRAAARSVSDCYACNGPLVSACRSRLSRRGQQLGQRGPPPISV